MKEFILIWILMWSVITTIAITSRLDTMNKNLETIIKLELAK